MEAESDLGIKPTQHTTHGIAERRYRESLNSKFEQLPSVLPSARADSGADRDTSRASCGFSKSCILSSAIEYIGDLGRERGGLVEQNWRLMTEIQMQRIRSDFILHNIAAPKSAVSNDKGNQMPDCME